MIEDLVGASPGDDEHPGAPGKVVQPMIERLETSVDGQQGPRPAAEVVQDPVPDPSHELADTAGSAGSSGGGTGRASLDIAAAGVRALPGLAGQRHLWGQAVRGRLRAAHLPGQAKCGAGGGDVWSVGGHLDGVEAVARVQAVQHVPPQDQLVHVPAQGHADALPPADAVQHEQVGQPGCECPAVEGLHRLHGQVDPAENLLGERPHGGDARPVCRVGSPPGGQHHGQAVRRGRMGNVSRVDEGEDSFRHRDRVCHIERRRGRPSLRAPLRAPPEAPRRAPRP